MSKTINKNYKKTILFDFDGVIHSYTSGWHGVDLALDKPVDGIKECIDQLKEKYLIYIYSSRCSHLEGLKCIEKYLKEYNIYSDKITNVKSAAYLTIDDRCICFDGNSYSLIDEIENFKPWTKLNFNDQCKDQQCEDQRNIKDDKEFNENNNQVDYMERCDFDSTYEGKMLLAAVSILTTSKFTFYGSEINGTKKEPNEICKMLNRLCSDMFADKNIIDGPHLSYDDEINKLKDRNQEIVLNFEMDIDHRFTNHEKCLINEIANNSIEIERLLNIKFNDLKYQKAMKIILNELKSDKSGGSMYYAWQSNLACIIQDNSNIDHELSNKIACKFLDRLINKDEI